jgi:hypothetical protein
MEERAGQGVALAIGILLLWLAGLAFFVAFEGSKFLAEGTNAPTYIGGIFDRMRQVATGEEDGS